VEPGAAPHALAGLGIFRAMTRSRISGRVVAVLSLLVVMLIWGSAYVVTKAALVDIPPLVFACLRFIVASLMLLPLALARGGLRRIPRPVPWRPLILMAFFGIGLYYILFNLGLVYTTASLGALMQSGIPAVIAIMALMWLHERTSKRRLFGIALTIVGVVIVLVGQPAGSETASNPLLGGALMFASMVAWAAYTIFAKRVAAIDSTVVTTCVTMLGTLMLVPAAIVEATYRPFELPPARAWISIVYLGAFPSATAYLLFNRSLRDLDARQVGAYINLVPIIGAVSGVVFLRESLSLWAIAGGILVLAGVWISTRGDEPTPVVAREAAAEAST
jgi:drug/metabolite transporter (DMT)-like permease